LYHQKEVKNRENLEEKYKVFFFLKKEKINFKKRDEICKKREYNISFSFSHTLQKNFLVSVLTNLS